MPSQLPDSQTDAANETDAAKVTDAAAISGASKVTDAAAAAADATKATAAIEAATAATAANAALLQLLIPGTDADVLSNYATLGKRSRDIVFGAFEEDIITLDVETTGLSYQRDTLIEIAAVRSRGPELIDQFSTFVNPGRPIPINITELTSITDADVADAPDALTAVTQLAEFVGDTCVVAHNSGFDRNMLRFATKQSFDFIEMNDWVDSLELARIALPRCRSHALQSLTEAFCSERSTHRAIDDALRLAELWRVMLTALTDLYPGLTAQIAELYPDTDWPLRRHIAMVAGAISAGVTSQANAILSTNSSAQVGNALPFSLFEARRTRMRQRPRQEKLDALELLGGRGALIQVDARETVAAFSVDGLLGKMYAHFEPRQEQTQMALAIAAALSTNTHLAVEAGTGVGKSMAYLVPMALFAKANKICCGVATKTNTLLDQLLYSELPRLDDALPGGIVFEALKGYDHYPCLRKLSSLTRPGQAERMLNTESITTVAALLTFVCQSSRGDMDHLRLRFQPGELSRFDIVASAEDCLKRRCRFYTSCLLHAARRTAAEADIVLTNQALLFCDITTEGGILPDIRHWAIDEAHGAEDEARDQLSRQVNPRDMASNLDALLAGRGMLQTMKDAALRIDQTTSLVERIDATMTESAGVPNICRSFMSDVKGLVALATGPSYSTAYNSVSLWINEHSRDSALWSDLFTSGAALSRRMRKLWQDCRDIISFANEFAELQEIQADMVGMTSELASAIDTLELILNGDDRSYVYAAELDRRPETQTDSLQALRINVGEVLAEALYPNTLSVIYTSATLATGSSFDYFANAVGLASLPSSSWRSLQLASSYDFDNNMAIYLPTDLPEPNSSGYREALEELLYQVHIALGGSVLTLFTNRREMEELYNRLHDRLEAAGIQLRCQWPGFSSRRLSEEFLANRELSLFALRSFWQGFDAPGDTLRCVVIPKLPFGSPTDPLASERSLRERNAWFKYALPEAIIDLRQAAGRLIRSSTDRGSLILADTRLLTKSYGSSFLAAMPSRQQHAMDTQSIATALKHSTD